jgi:hypothetical protein
MEPFHYTAFKSNAAMHSEDKEKYGKKPKDDPAWTALRSLLTRQWFTRMWIPQELLLGKQVFSAVAQRS